MGRAIPLGDFVIGQGYPLSLISGPCVIESEEHCLLVAEKLVEIISKREINLIFKASFDKANRSSLSSYRGPGLEEGLRILERVGREFSVPVVTDVHTAGQAQAAAEVCPMIQIPAFLCRQTDLLLAAGKTGRVINVKKGQFMAPWDMGNAVEKIASTGNQNILLTERGVCFGYNHLVSDFRSIPIMQQLGYPVCYDATHSIQLPGKLGGSSGGQREFIPMLAKAAVVAGADCLFMETHPEPEKAKSDAACVFPLDQMSQLLGQVEEIYALVSSF